MTRLSARKSEQADENFLGDKNMPIFKNTKVLYAQPRPQGFSLKKWVAPPIF